MNTEELLARAAGGDVEARKELVATRRRRADRQRVIADLVAFLERGYLGLNAPAATATAIDILGELRAEEAIPVLLNYLTFRPVDPSDLGFDGRLKAVMPPAVNALAKIGEPAIAPLLERVRRSGPREHALAATAANVLLAIAGPRQAATLIQRELDGASKRAQRRLQAVLDYVPPEQRRTARGRR